MATEVNDAERIDHRAARWDDHRAERRRTLTAAAVAAIDQHGPDASIADIASVAGISKPVLYRHFADKDDLYRAVGEHGADLVLDALRKALASPGSPRERLAAACASYLQLIASHPNVFLVLVAQGGKSDALRGGMDRIAATLARRLSDAFLELRIDAAAAEPWAHGVVGFGMAHGEWWLRRRTMSRAAAAHYLAEFIWHGLDGIAREAGVDLNALGHA